MNACDSKENTPKKKDLRRDWAAASPRKWSPVNQRQSIVPSSASPKALYGSAGRATTHSGPRFISEVKVSPSSVSKSHTSEIRKKKSRPTQKHAKKGNWTDEEDNKLFEWVNANGCTRWTECSRFIPNRCGKQCRERWVNILNPDIKRGEWTDNEQRTLFRWLPQYTTSWSLMAGVLPGRTENSIKNYFYSSIRRLKSSPIVHVVYDLHVNRRTAAEDLDQQSGFLRTELEKLNVFGREICMHMLGSELNDLQFRDFILSLLFEDGEEEGKDGQTRPRVVPKMEVRKAVIRDGISETGVALRNTLTEVQIRDRNAKAVAEVLKSLGEINQLGYLSLFLKSLEVPLHSAVARETKNRLMIELPGCWNCPK
jgi:hypothetical protein